MVVLGGVADPVKATRWVLPHFGAGPVVVGPMVTSLTEAGESARIALEAFSVAAAWPDAPRPCASSELLPERALAGQPEARSALVSETVAALTSADPVLVDTLATFLERAGSLEATARALVVHTNTVRYRLRRVADITGFTPTDPRGAFALRLGLAFSRLNGQPAPSVLPASAALGSSSW